MRVLEARPTRLRVINAQLLYLVNECWINAYPSGTLIVYDKRQDALDAQAKNARSVDKGWPSHTSGRVTCMFHLVSKPQEP